MGINLHAGFDRNINHLGVEACIVDRLGPPNLRCTDVVGKRPAQVLLKVDNRSPFYLFFMEWEGKKKGKITMVAPPQALLPGPVKVDCRSFILTLDRAGEKGYPENNENYPAIHGIICSGR